MKSFIFVYFLFTSLPVFAQQEIDAVVEGKKAFETYGCTVCHAIDKADKSFRTGPNLYGLFHTFLLQPSKYSSHPEYDLF